MAATTTIDRPAVVTRAPRRPGRAIAHYALPAFTFVAVC